MVENIADGTDKTPTVEDLQARLNKAEAKIVDLKNTPTKEVEVEVKEEISETKTETNWLSRDELEKFYTEKKFYETNPELSEHKEQLSELTSKGLSFEDAKYLLQKKDPTIAARQKTQQSNFTAWETPVDVTSFSKEQLWAMSQEDYNKARDLIDAGKAKYTT